MPIKISITGVLGGGKSAVCKELEKFNLKYFSTGVIQRGVAVEMGMTTLELNEYSETHPEIDKLIDSELCGLSDSPDDMVIDSRMAWHFVKDTFKVFLWADETVAAKRVMSHERGPSEKYADCDRAKCGLKARKYSENLRFKQKYGVDCGDFFNYDLVIDTTDVLPEYIAGVIMDKCMRRNSAPKRPVFLISPRCLYPTLYPSPLIKEDTRPGEPVKVVCSGGYFFIYSGHGLIGELCKKDKPTVAACELIAQNEDIIGGLTANEYVMREYSVHKAQAWEDVNGFRYETRPLISSAPIQHLLAELSC